MAQLIMGTENKLCFLRNAISTIIDFYNNCVNSNNPWL